MMNFEIYKDEPAPLVCGLVERVNFYVRSNAANAWRYLIEGVVVFFLSKIPSFVGMLVRQWFYRFLITAEGSFFLERDVLLKYCSKIRLGKNVYIDRNVVLHAGPPNGISIGENTTIHYATYMHVWNFRGIKNSGIKIGKNCSVGALSFVHGHGGVTIGDYVIMGNGVSIDPSHHVFEDATVPIRKQGVLYPGAVIEDDVWIGSRAVILGGVRIGKGSVIGAGAVVTRDIPPFSIAVGVPANVVGKREKK